LVTCRKDQRTILSIDLADQSGPQRIAEEIEPRPIHVNFLVNKAGFSLGGEFLSHDPRQEQASRKQSRHQDACRTLSLVMRIAAMETANVGLHHRWFFVVEAILVYPHSVWTT
jgi:hypothetical protein